MRFVSRTHTGRVRSVNQDFLGILDDACVAIVADGIGGKKFGEVASKLAVDSCVEYLGSLNEEQLARDPRRHLVNAIKYANDEIITVQRNEPDYANMGSTLACFAVHQKTLSFSWVGDSRVYRISPKQQSIALLSKDHTLDRDKIDKNLAPKLYKRAASILTQMVGSILFLKPDNGESELSTGDIVLCCTDGLTDRVPDELILEYAMKLPNLDDLADKLLDRALDCGGQDNITLVLAGS